METNQTMAPSIPMVSVALLPVNVARWSDNSSTCAGLQQLRAVTATVQCPHRNKEC
eukprot:CAMPEP_0170310424 /NCGR_PEP_ID=MMETSP0116_2-20130129/55696_1 /TAXON_ID=400756 /ORGANISM="Durinskia baltica, Strain CSIRO CS-38" /LENGTH=55 /DNA_ID=CAMNT_0010562695 /DNA_START=38 /DNA_END=202 /DNA_ORIENTATION=-